MATYKIPQKANPEDKIIGPFTFRDIVFLIIAGALCYLIYSFLPQNPLIEFELEEILFIMTMIVFFAVVFVFIKPEERGLEFWFADLMRFLNMPKTSLWQKSEKILPIFETNAEEAANKKAVAPLTTKEALADKQKIFHLSSIIDNPEQTLLEKSDYNIMSLLYDDEEIEKNKKAIQAEKKDLENAKKKAIDKKQSQEIITLLKNQEEKLATPFPKKESAVLVKPVSGLKGVFSGIMRNVSSLFLGFSSAKKSASAIVAPKNSVVTLVKENPETKKPQQTNPETQTTTSSKIINPSTPPEQLMAELKRLQKEKKTPPPSGEKAVQTPKPVKIISEADPLA